MTHVQLLCRSLAFLLTVSALGIAKPTFAGDDEAPSFGLGIEMTGATDYMDTGLTNSDHRPSAGLTLTPTYGIFYGTIYGANIDYGSKNPWLETKFAVGATPVFGSLSVDFNLARRIKIDDPSADRWLPYVTGTYTFNDKLNASLGVGYYAYDDKDTADFWELYAASTAMMENGSWFTGELYWEPNADGNGNSYTALYGTVGLPFMEKFEASLKLGYEGYEDDKSTPSYIWSQLGVKYSFDDHFSVFAGYHSNNLSATECPAQAYTDCKGALFAKVTYTMQLSDLFAHKK